MERYSALGVTGSGVGGFTRRGTGLTSGRFTGRLRGYAVEVVCGGEVEEGGVAVTGGGCVLGWGRGGRAGGLGAQLFLTAGVGGHKGAGRLELLELAWYMGHLLGLAEEILPP